MKYTSKIKSEQTVQIGDGKSVMIKPGQGELKKEEAVAVAQTPWGQRLIDTGYLTFEEKIEVKVKKPERGMTIPPGKKKPTPPADGNTEASGNENTSAEAGNTEESGNTDTEASGDETVDEALNIEVVRDNGGGGEG
jgi:hypothetical protein